MHLGARSIVAAAGPLFALGVASSWLSAAPRGGVPRREADLPRGSARATIQRPRAQQSETTTQAPPPAPVESEVELIPPDQRSFAPGLPPELEWVRVPQIKVEMLRGSVVLVEVWESSCINCLRTLPTISRLSARYSMHGLVALGIHSPEFGFTASRTAVERAARRFGLEFPIASDTHQSFWQSWDVQVWPTTFLLDAHGRLAAIDQGELHSSTLERQIRTLLLEARPDTALPELLSNGPEIDPFAPECGFVTPEIRIAPGRDFLLNPERVRPGDTIVYGDPGPARTEGTFFLRGPWSWLANGLQRGSGPAPASIGITYTGKEVYAVLVNQGALPQDIEIRQDGRPLTEANRGADVVVTDGRSIVRLGESRLHYLVVNPDVGRHDLELFPTSPFFQIHSFSFGNRCQTDFPHR